MIDVKDGFLRCLRKEAVLACLAGALADQLDEADRYMLTHVLGYLPPVLLAVE